MAAYEPRSDNRISAAEEFDKFRSYVDAGFTEGQAMQIILSEHQAMMIAGITHFLQNPSGD